MALVLVTANRDPLPEEEDREPFANVHYGGVYFFLYPAIEELHDMSGELIDPQHTSYFSGEVLGALEGFVTNARESAMRQPPEWSQRVGVLEGAIDYRLTSRKEVIDLLQAIQRAIAKARQDNMGVLFWGT